MTNAQAALAQVREALRDEALHDPDAALSDTIDAIRALIVACSPANMTAILAHVKAQEAEIERLTAERDDLRRQLDECSQMLARQAAEIERLTASLKRANETAEHFERHWYLRGDEIERLTAERDDLRRQLDEAEQDARRYRWIAGHCRSTSEHWGGRWSIIVDGPAPTAHDTEDAFDAAIDAAMRLTRPAEER